MSKEIDKIINKHLNNEHKIINWFKEYEDKDLVHNFNLIKRQKNQEKFFLININNHYWFKIFLRLLKKYYTDKTQKDLIFLSHKYNDIHIIKEKEEFISFDIITNDKQLLRFFREI